MAAPPAKAATVQAATVNGSVVDRVAWTDAAGQPRTVSLKREGNGNAGHGGYAVQMTYRYPKNGALATMTVNPSDAGDGFGYFVGHERYRTFTDGSSAPIASKIFGVDDSPLGRGFPVTGRIVPTTANRVIVEFKLTYPKYGTLLPNGIDQDTGEDSPPLGTSRALFKRYDLPVTITWYFQDGTSWPRIVTRVGLAPVPGPDRVSFDLRGPYGKMNFDGAGGPITWVVWADRYRFGTKSGAADPQRRLELGQAEHRRPLQRAAGGRLRDGAVRARALCLLRHPRRLFRRRAARPRQPTMAAMAAPTSPSCCPATGNGRTSRRSTSCPTTTPAAPPARRRWPGARRPITAPA